MLEVISRSPLWSPAIALSLAACHPGEGTSVFTGSTMGTTYTVKVLAPSSSAERERALSRLIENELDNVDRKMSTYRPDSELSLFNGLSATTPVRVSSDTLEVLEAAQEVSELSGGAFDVTVFPLVKAWGFGPEKSDVIPSEALVRELLKQVGYSNVEVDRHNGTIRKRLPLVSCDLSGIAPGYAVDRIASSLEREGITRFMIEVGGEVRTSGLNEADEPWRIGIERPDTPEPTGGSLERVVPLSGGALSTSGDYRDYREVGGRRLSHTIDPRTGHPIAHSLASVSVVDKTCMRADALATALNVLGPDEGYAFAVERGLAAFFIVRESGGFSEKATPAFVRLSPR